MTKSKAAVKTFLVIGIIVGTVTAAVAIAICWRSPAKMASLKMDCLSNLKCLHVYYTILMGREGNSVKSLTASEFVARAGQGAEQLFVCWYKKMYGRQPTSSPVFLSNLPSPNMVGDYLVHSEIARIYSRGLYDSWIPVMCDAIGNHPDGGNVLTHDGAVRWLDAADPAWNAIIAEFARRD